MTFFFLFFFKEAFDASLFKENQALGGLSWPVGR